jgi:hypothetical protein
MWGGIVSLKLGFIVMDTEFEVAKFSRDLIADNIKRCMESMFTSAALYRLCSSSAHRLVIVALVGIANGLTITGAHNSAAEKAGHHDIE